MCVLWTAIKTGKTTLRHRLIHFVPVVTLRRINYHSICISFGFSILLILTALACKLSTKNTAENYGGIFENLTTSEIRKIFKDTQTEIKHDLSKYNFSVSGAHVLEDLVMESGGQPLRSLIMSTWRSGSTFLGELLNAIPGTYYHYEPLITFKVKQIRGPPEAPQALSIVKDLFKCDYGGLYEDLKYGRRFINSTPNHLKRNTRLWKRCSYKTDLCFDTGYKSQVCKLFPFQAMKVTRLRLWLIKEILDDQGFNVKVILLVRDPRGVMQSRLRTDFCHTPDCFDPSLVCGDMISDYEAVARLLPEYPDKLMVLRFEELAMNLNRTAHKIVKFLRLNPTPSLDAFLQLHTNKEMGNVYSTFRVSRNVPFKWKYKLPFNYVKDMQMMQSCKEAMRLWGYKMAHNRTHMTSKDYNPVEDFII